MRFRSPGRRRTPEGALAKTAEQTEARLGTLGENTATGDIDQARGRRWHSGMARMAGMAVMRHRHARPQASKISDLVRSCKVSCKVFKVLRRG